MTESEDILAPQVKSPEGSWARFAKLSSSSCSQTLRLVEAAEQGTLIVHRKLVSENKLWNRCDLDWSCSWPSMTKFQLPDGHMTCQNEGGFQQKNWNAAFNKSCSLTSDERLLCNPQQKKFTGIEQCVVRSSENKCSYCIYILWRDRF